MPVWCEQPQSCLSQLHCRRCGGPLRLGYWLAYPGAAHTPGVFELLRGSGTQGFWGSKTQNDGTSHGSSSRAKVAPGQRVQTRLDINPPCTYTGKRKHRVDEERGAEVMAHVSHVIEEVVLVEGSPPVVVLKEERVEQFSH